MNLELQRSQNWVYTTRRPDGVGGRDNMYFFEPFEENGWLREDDYRWYRLNCRYWFGDWIETHDPGLWEAYGGRHRAIYVVREDLMTLIKLKWL